jgi:hypothetical protein
MDFQRRSRAVCRISRRASHNLYDIFAPRARPPRAADVIQVGLAGEALRPPAAPLPSRGLSRPRAPTTRNPARFLRPPPTVRRLDTRSGFRARHHDEMRSASRHLTNPARIGCTATAYPVASIFGAFPQNPASAVSPADTNDRRLAAPDRQQERGPCTPFHDGRA